MESSVLNRALTLSIMYIVPELLRILFFEIVYRNNSPWDVCWVSFCHFSTLLMLSKNHTWCRVLTSLEWENSSLSSLSCELYSPQNFDSLSVMTFTLNWKIGVLHFLQFVYKEIRTQINCSRVCIAPWILSCKVPGCGSLSRLIKSFK